MIEAYKKAILNYANFQGVATRSEYWLFLLCNVLIGFFIGFIGALISPNSVAPMTTLYQLLVLMPSISLTVRRTHDSNHSGWWALLPIVNFIFMFFPSVPSRYRIIEVN
jgi:uncharacterized membrane protein YhaH (DUF805 family)